jgi:hypothetical protein
MSRGTVSFRKGKAMNNQDYHNRRLVLQLMASSPISFLAAKSTSANVRDLNVDSNIGDTSSSTLANSTEKIFELAF